jgi:hypothetical protein
VTGRDAQLHGDLIEAEPKSHQTVYRGQSVEGQVLSGIVLDGLDQRPLAIVQPALEWRPALLSVRGARQAVPKWPFRGLFVSPKATSR